MKGRERDSDDDGSSPLDVFIYAFHLQPIQNLDQPMSTARRLVPALGKTKIFNLSKFSISNNREKVVEIGRTYVCK